MLKDFRRFRRLRFGTAALAIRPQRPWWWRWAGNALIVALCIVLGFGALQLFGLDWLSPLRLQADNTRLRSEREAVLDSLRVAQESLALQERTRREDQAARDSLAQDLASLREENLHLKEDLASLRSLMAPEGTAGGIRLSGLRVRATAVPGEYRWHLLVAQGGRQVQDFQGRVTVRTEYAPGESHDTGVAGQDGTQTLNFKYYGELEGSLRTPPGSHLRRVSVEVWRNGDRQPAASQSVLLTQ